MVGHIGSIAPRVHANCAANRPRDGSQKCQIKARRRRLTRRHGIEHRRTHDYTIALNAQTIEAAPHADDHSPDSTIPDDQIGTDTHRKD